MWLCAGMTEQGLKTDVLFCYDLELPADFWPQPKVCDCDLFAQHHLLLCSQGEQ